MFAKIVVPFALLAATTEVHAQAATSTQRVHRCVGRHGEIVFSGLPCRSDAAAVGSALASDAANPVASSPALSMSCPATRAELRERIAAAVTQRDANGLASLLRWNDVGGRAAGTRLRELRDLTQRPLLAIEDGSADATDRATDANSDHLRLRTGSGAEGGVREHSFGVSAHAGCYWLEW